MKHGKLAAVLLLGCLLPACQPTEDASGEAPPPNVVLITIDTLRADHLGCYGYFRKTSPNIDALAAESVLFENCSVPMATTLPSHVSMLTGTWPIEHGVLANVSHGGKVFKPAPGARSLAQALSEIGFATAGFVSAKPLRRHSGIDAGFATYDDPQGAARFGALTTDRALAWLEQHKRAAGDQPYFLWLHLFDPHDPYTPPPKYRGAFRADAALDQFLLEREMAESSRRPGGQQVFTLPAHDGYDAEILYADAQVGRLLDALRESGDLERSAVVLLTDHGEGLGQHAAPGHGLIWNEQVHSAWLMRAPGLAPRRVAARVSSVDFLPTLLANVALPGLEALAQQCSGEDVLAPQFAGRPQFSQTSARLIQFGQPVRHCITRDRWKLHWRSAGDPLLYDLQADPHELADLAQQEPEVVERLRLELMQHLQTLATRATALGAGEEIELDAATLKALNDLGYTGTDKH